MKTDIAPGRLVDEPNKKTQIILKGMNVPEHDTVGINSSIMHTNQPLLKHQCTQRHCFDIARLQKKTDIPKHVLQSCQKKNML